MNKIIKFFALGILFFIPYLYSLVSLFDTYSPDRISVFEGTYVVPIWAKIPLIISSAIMVYVLYLAFTEPRE